MSNILHDRMSLSHPVSDAHYIGNRRSKKMPAVDLRALGIVLLTWLHLPPNDGPALPQNEQIISFKFARPRAGTTGCGRIWRLMARKFSLVSRTSPTTLRPIDCAFNNAESREDTCVGAARFVHDLSRSCLTTGSRPHLVEAGGMTTWAKSRDFRKVAK